MWALALFTLGDGMTALALPWNGLLASRVVAGLGAAGFTPALYAYIADHVSPEKRTQRMAIASAGFSSATFLGIPLGLILAGVFGWSGAFWLIFVMAALSWGVTRQMWDARKAAKPPGALRLTLPRNLWGNFLVTALAFASFGTVYTYLPLDLVHMHHLSHSELTWFMMAFGFAGLSGTLIAGRLGDSWGNLRLIRWAIVIETGVLLTLYGHPAIPWLWVLLLAYSAVSSYVPALKSLISQAGAKGLALSWNNSAMYLGLSAGASTGAWLWPSGMPAVYLGSAILLGAGLFTVWRFVHTHDPA